jgi:rRNA pseudouridine-1189 N-methylase Emg1 (Nep1/Mra1 family)
MTRFLKATKLDDLVTDLSNHGLIFTDSEGEPTEPQPFQVVSNENGAVAIYLGHVPLEPAEYDEEGEETKAAVYSPDFHANVSGTAAVFTTEMSEVPTVAYNVFAE